MNILKWTVPMVLLTLTVLAGGYDRAEWGGWRGGCHDTRNLVLEREAAKGSLGWKTDKRCKVTAGVWYGPYTGVVYTSPRQIQIDHMVPLKAAWESGAKYWTTDKKRDYFNDLRPGHLLAVQGRANMQKGARGPEGWLPAVGQCEYVNNWVTVKERWGLTLTVPEVRAIWGVLSKCAQ